MKKRNQSRNRRKIEVLLFDNYDSFTYNLYDYLLQLGANCRVVRNDELTLLEVQKLHFDVIVLSPGPGKPKDAGIMMEIIAYYFDKIPILGICLGHQGIGEFFGATLSKAAYPMHGKTSRVFHKYNAIFKNISSPTNVMRYHSLILTTIDKSIFEILAKTARGEVMAIAHRTLPLVGLQFHPESILTPKGLEMLGNWLDMVVEKDSNISLSLKKVS